MSGGAPTLIWCPFPDEGEAARSSDILLSEGLIACANLIPAMRSLYVWEGERGEANECGALFKTNELLLAAAIQRLEELHPYDAPAIVGWRAEGAGEATKAWLGGLGRLID